MEHDWFPKQKRNIHPACKSILSGGVILLTISQWIFFTSHFDANLFTLHHKYANYYGQLSGALLLINEIKRDQSLLSSHFVDTWYM